LSIHVVGVSGLVLVFLIGALRPINLGALALVMTYLVGTIFVREGVKEMYSGFPVDLLVLLVGVTYLFAIAESNGAVGRVVAGAARLVKGRRRCSRGLSLSWRRCRRWRGRWGRQAWRCWRRSRCGSRDDTRLIAG